MCGKSRVGKDHRVIKDRQGIVEYSALPCLSWMRNLLNATARKYTIRLQQAVMISRVCSLGRILVVSVALLNAKQPYKVTPSLTSYYNKTKNGNTEDIIDFFIEVQNFETLFKFDRILFSINST